MLLKIYRKNLLPNTLGLLAYATLLRLPHFYFNTSLFPGDHSSFLGRFIGYTGGYFWQILSVLGAFLAAVMLNRIFIRNRLTSEINLFPGLIFLLLLSWTPTGWFWHISLVAILLLLVAIDHIYTSYKHTAPQGEAFNVGVLLGILTIIYPAVFFIFLFAFVGFIIIRNFKAKETLQLVIGLGCPFFLAGTISYSLDQFSILKAHLLTPFSVLQFSALGLKTEWVYLILPLLCIVCAVMLYTVIISKKNNQAIKKLDIMYWLLACVALCVPVGFAVDLSIVSLAIVPTSLLIGVFISRLELGFWAELLHVFLIGLTIYLQIRLYI